MRLNQYGLSRFSVAVFFFLAACTTHPSKQIRDTLVPEAAEGVRWGLLVTDTEGRELISWRADQRFLPASNTKLFSTAAVFYWEGELAEITPELSTRLLLEPSADNQPPDLVLVGRGDPEVRDDEACETRCLADLADAVAEAGLLEVDDIIGDDTWFPEERWPYGWSWEDLQTEYGTAVSALIVNDNVVELIVEPGAAPGEPVTLNWTDGQAFFEVRNEALTAYEDTRLRVERLPGSDTLRLSGVMQSEAEPKTLLLGVEDPALTAARRLRRRLAERGVAVLGETRARHRPVEIASDAPPADKGVVLTPVEASEPPPSGDPIAALPPISWIDGLTRISKDSQNLYAEALLRQLGRLSGDGATEDGLERIEAMLEAAQADPNGYDLFDGSGMSVYNRVSPRTIVTLLHFAARQDWGADWRATFPIGGVDGSLEDRFRGTPLEGRIFAKTGTLKGVNALSGYMIAKSGETLVFSIIANERPLSVSSATPLMDAALVRIAERY